VFGVVLLLVISAGIYVTGKAAGEAWPDVWLPNFIAEWSGILIAVVLVERVLARERLREREEARAPLRLAVASTLSLALENVIDFAIDRYADEKGVDEAEDPVQAAPFLVEWSRTVEDQMWTRDAFSVGWWATTLKNLSESLVEIRAKYVTVLDPAEIRRLDDLERSARGKVTFAQTIADDLVPGKKTAMLGVLGKQAPGIIAGMCSDVALCVSPVADVCGAITGAPLTTAGAWQNHGFKKTLYENVEKFRLEHEAKRARGDA
jgi:hypothetical protein